MTRRIEDTRILITGATDGLGRGVAQRLAADGATLLLHGRDPDRLAATADEIRRATGNGHISTYRADLASLAEVSALADEVRGSSDALHVLINNAGIGAGKPDERTRQESRDGHELRFAVNHLAGFSLTLRLLPLLLRSSPARVVHVASLGQAPIDFDDPMILHDYSGGRAYGQSKLAQITIGFELASRIPAAMITVNSLHPATYMPTKIVLEEAGRSVDTLEEGIDATVRLATSADMDGVTGRFYDRQRESRPHDQAYEPDARARLWKLSVDLTGAPEPG